MTTCVILCAVLVILASASDATRTPHGNRQDSRISNLAARTINSTHVLVNWSKPRLSPDDVTMFVVYYTSSPGSDVTKWDKMAVRPEEGRATLRSLKPGTEYRVMVMAKYRTFPGGYSNIVKVTTTGPGMPGPTSRFGQTSRHVPTIRPSFTSPPDVTSRSVPRRSSRTRRPIPIRRRRPRPVPRPVRVRIPTPRSQNPTRVPMTVTPVVPPTTGEVRGRTFLESPVQRILEDRLSDPDLHKFPPVRRLPLTVTFNISLVDIIAISKKTNEVSLSVRFAFQWTDPSLSWNPREHNGILRHGMPTSIAWTPDIVPLGLTRPLEPLSPPTMSVNHHGLVTWVPAYRMTTMCDVRKGACTLNVSSWVHDRSILALTAPQNVIDVSSYFSRSRFTVGATSVRRRAEDVVYGDLSFTQITASFSFRKRK